MSSIRTVRPCADVIRAATQPWSLATPCASTRLRRYGGRRRAPSYHGYHGSLRTPCHAFDEIIAGASACRRQVDAMSKMCPAPTVRPSRGRRVYRGRGSTVEALPRLRKRKLWPIIGQDQFSNPIDPSGGTRLFEVAPTSTDCPGDDGNILAAEHLQSAPGRPRLFHRRRQGPEERSM